jgi:hypothetical protein
MRLTTLSSEAANRLAIDTLGLDSDSIDLRTKEGIASSLRRAASFMCPTSPSRLVDAVVGVIRPLGASELEREEVAGVLELVVASGDLLELRREEDRSTRLLYLGPPSFVERVPGTYVLIGVRPFGAPLVDDDEISRLIEYEGHTRLLTLNSDGGPNTLSQLGLRSISRNMWISSPSADSPKDLIDRYSGRLSVARDAGQIEDLKILDPNLPVSYYAGRWRAVESSDDGDFISRRPQAYGADLWCLSRVSAGAVQRLIELPVDDPVAPGRDEAWRYQAAADAMNGTPQRFRIRPGAVAGQYCILDFYSPLPGFAERYVQFAGLALGKTPGALFSYRVPDAATKDVATFLTDMLWMAQQEAPRGV